MGERELPDLPAYPPGISAPDLAAYRLQVGGAVARPLSLTVAQVQALPAVTVTDDFRCLEGWVVRARSWQGVRLEALLLQAGLLPAAGYVAAWAADHQGRYNVLLSREQALAPNTIVAWAREGRALEHAHGAPLRLYVPGADCFVQVKWLSRLEAMTEAMEVQGPAIALGRLQQPKDQTTC